ncbi:MAG: GH92 family glycosyl hydrolase [Bacteroidales bacterium]|nr:GH92 family glycosyl hydrolase [Bacteroidales bacterium]
MRKFSSAIILASVLILGACSSGKTEKTDYTSYVNTKIGSGGHGHVFVGAGVPFGMVQLGPTSIPQDWDWCSGYHDSDNSVIGFSHTHLEGTGIGDLFDVTVMPVIGEVTYARGESSDPSTGLWSPADRSKEVSTPGYYSVPLSRYGILAEMTATNRVGLHRYTFPASDEAAIVFDLRNGGCWDTPYGTWIEKVSDNSIRGYRYSSGWASNQRVFFHAEFSKPFDNITFIDGPNRDDNGSVVEKPMYARMDFKTTEGEQILVKVAISPVSMEGATANMAAELPGWNFENVVSDATAAWNAELSKIDVTTSDADDRTIFYTALYHTMIHPATFSDVDGKYRGSDDVVREDKSFTNYTIFSLWDTYRAAMPLLNILHPEKADDMVNTMLKIYEQQGKLPVWHLWANETDCMVGNPGVIAVGDAIVKGYNGFDVNAAYEAMKNSVMLDERGQNLRKQYGFIPSDLYNESIGNDMEYAIADGAVANVAAFLGKTEDEAFFRERSHSYRNYMDKETLLARGRLKDGSWRSPFNPFVSNHREQDYVEGNAWQYTWLAPQDFDGLVDFYGSREKFVSQLDTLFAQEERIDGENASPDISGLIGQYVHGNEPSHHIIYFYTMAGEPAKAADHVREVYEKMYFNNENGLAGNEDEGQMSAWYVLSSLGFYQVEPASTRFWFGAPNFPKMDVKVKGGVFSIIAEGLDETSKYIQSVELNGAPYNKGYIEFSDIEKGGTLKFIMGSTPAKWY